MKRIFSVLLGLIILSWLMGDPRSTMATPIYNPDNGHYYDAIAGDLNWLTAKGLADSSTYNGIQGHLATLTSQGENDWAWNNLGSNLSYYLLGGTDMVMEGAWEWVTREPWGYTNWSSEGNLIEPNNMNNEDGLQFWGNGRWNDTSIYSNTRGYIVEYDSSPLVPDPVVSAGVNTSSVPEPGTISLFGSGMILSLFGWRKLSMKHD